MRLVPATFAFQPESELDDEDSPDKAAIRVSIVGASTMPSCIKASDNASLTSRDGAHDHHGLGTTRDRVRQRGIRRHVRQIFLTGKEPDE